MESFRLSKRALGTCLLILVPLLVTACGGDPALRTRYC